MGKKRLSRSGNFRLCQGNLGEMKKVRELQSCSVLTGFFEVFYKQQAYGQKHYVLKS